MDHVVLRYFYLAFSAVIYKYHVIFSCNFLKICSMLPLILGLVKESVCKQIISEIFLTSYGSEYHWLIKKILLFEGVFSLSKIPPTVNQAVLSYFTHWREEITRTRMIKSHDNKGQPKCFSTYLVPTSSKRCRLFHCRPEEAESGNIYCCWTED